jgi:two-component system alkaline phosphatase synthesis response regulator PhoP
MADQILVVDDDSDLVYILKETLEKQGYQVITASEGNEALKLLRTNTPHLMIVDLTMPGMGGWHLTTKIRQDKRFRTTPVIVLSGLLERDADPQEFESASAYVVKPFDIFKLLEKIKQLLQKSS